MSDNGPTSSTALFLLTMGEVPNFYSGFLPSLFTIATFSSDPDDVEKTAHTRRWIRRGEIQATTMAMVVGVATSLIAGDPAPFIGTVIMSAYLLYQYEHALRMGERGGLHINMDKGA